MIFCPQTKSNLKCAVNNKRRCDADPSLVPSYKKYLPENVTRKYIEKIVNFNLDIKEIEGKYNTIKEIQDKINSLKLEEMLKDNSINISSDIFTWICVQCKCNNTSKKSQIGKRILCSDCMKELPDNKWNKIKPYYGQIVADELFG